MSSASDYQDSAPPSSPYNSPLRERPSQSRTPLKRRRLESVEPSRVRRYYLEGKYNDAYRLLYNDHVAAAADPFALTDAPAPHYQTLFGASTWSAHEQATLFAALERLGRDNVPAIAHAVGTKSIPETRDLLLLLSTAASQADDTGLTLRDVPAAVDVNPECSDQLDIMAEALAWYQEQFEMTQEQDRYGDYWLINPTVADDIERALSGDRRRATLTPPTPTTNRRACFRCRRHKIRCDRNKPCSNCARSKEPVDCEYADNHDTVLDAAEQSEIDPDNSAPAPPDQANDTPRIVQHIPEAALLHPEAMLTLSKTLFMNRSPDFPSPWPHWSEYASDHVPEPAMFRTAFNDFHTLAVSLTKRLMHTAIMQATSRLRSQRRRLRKGVQPMVKKRDVLAAIDVLGLERDAKHRWRGAARRCGVRVYDEKRITKFKSRKWDVSYDQVEQILGSYETTVHPDADASDPSGDERSQTFKNRAARSGTPLPMEQLVLSDSDSASPTDLDDHPSESDAASDHNFPSSRIIRDPSGRFASVAPPSSNDPHPTRYTLEQFDLEASRQEEQELCDILGLSPPPKVEPKSDDEPDSDLDSEDVTTADDWRPWTPYHAEWESFPAPVPAARFAANQKPHDTSQLAQPAESHTTDPGSESGSDTGASTRRSTRKRSVGLELQMQNPRAYAALQGNVYNDGGLGSDADDSEGEDEARSEADVPAQSVENTLDEDVMDWKV